MSNVAAIGDSLAAAAQCLLMATGAEGSHLTVQQLDEVCGLLQSLPDCAPRQNGQVHPTTESAEVALQLVSDPTARDALLAILAVAVRRGMQVEVAHDGNQSSAKSSDSTGRSVSTGHSQCSTSSPTAAPGVKLCASPQGPRGGTTTAAVAAAHPADPGPGTASTSSVPPPRSNAGAMGYATGRGVPMGCSSGLKAGYGEANSQHAGDAAGVIAVDDCKLGKAWWQLYLATTNLHARILCRIIGRDGGKPPLPAVDFARRLLRSQALHCLSRPVAAAAAAARRLLPTHRASEAHAANPEGGARAAAPADRLPARKAVSTVAKCAFALSPALGLVSNLARLASCCNGRQPSNAPPPAAAAYVSELAAALRDSSLLEHAARGVTAAAELAHRFGAAAAAGRPARSGEGQPSLALLGRAYHYFEDLLRELAYLSTNRVGGAEQVPGVYGSLMSPGTCASFAVMAFGIAAMCAADGGTGYGTPPALLQPLIRSAVPVQACSVGPSLLRTGSLVALMALLQNAAAEPRRRRVALLLRIARVLVASAQLWARPEGGEQDARQEGQQQQQQSPRGAGAARPVAGGSGTDGAAAGGSAGDLGRSVGTASGRASALPTPLAVVDKVTCALLTGTVFAAVDALLADATTAAAAEPAAKGGWVQAAAAERWRLALGAAGCMAQWASRNQLSAVVKVTRLQLALQPLSDDAFPPPELPPDLAAALEGGLLPCLERLVRRAAQHPAGPEANLLDKILAGAPMAGVVGGLLAYGDPRQAAALTVTLGKALRRLAPLLLEAYSSYQGGRGQGQRASGSGGGGGVALGNAGTRLPVVARVAFRLCAAVSYQYSLLLALRSIAPVFAQPGSSGAAPAVPSRFMAHACYAMCEWLPPLGRLAQQAALVLESQPSHRVGKSLARVCIHMAAEALMGWLPLLASPDAAAAQPAEAGACASSSTHGACPSRVLRQRFLAEGVDAVSLTGAVLRLATVPDAHALRRLGAARDELQLLTTSLCSVAATCTQQLRRGALQAALAAAQGAQAGGAFSALSFWPPQLLRRVAADLQTHGIEASSLTVSHIAGQVESWMLGGEGNLGLEGFEKICTMVGISFASGPPDEAPGGWLRRCGNPGCTNLAGDSEAELPLKACAGCGVVGYCGRECQTAHWRAGHGTTCEGRRSKPQARGATG